jgi:hypothetical protein
MRHWLHWSASDEAHSPRVAPVVGRKQRAPSPRLRLLVVRARSLAGGRAIPKALSACAGAKASAALDVAKGGMMSKGRDFTRIIKRDRASKATRNRVAWGLHKRDKAAASLGAPQPPSKAELRQQAAAAWAAWQEAQRCVQADGWW